jgi:hypothetical protein
MAVPAAAQPTPSNILTETLRAENDGASLTSSSTLKTRRIEKRKQKKVRSK